MVGINALCLLICKRGDSGGHENPLSCVSSEGGMVAGENALCLAQRVVVDGKTLQLNSEQGKVVGGSSTLLSPTRSDLI